MKERYQKWLNRLQSLWNYWNHGVWEDTSSKFYVSLIKTLNITIKSFLNTDVQSKACALTYRTLLAIVPALALLFAIGRGFGFQNLLQDELYKLLPSQKEAISHALAFVDSYLNQASEGIFVGVGIVFLLWTLISLLSSVEDSFNNIWGVKQGRSIWRKITDYTAMFLILPILIICGSGFAIFLNNTILAFFNLPFLSPLFSYLFEFASYFFTCLFFAAVFMFIPNTKVRFQNAFLSGVFTGTAFLILQWIFITGQLYVSKYNAIYGSFSFLPLLLIWLQLVWVICLSGCLICYASQNIIQFSYNEQISDIAPSYYEKVTVAIATLIIQNFESQKKPLTTQQLVRGYGIPTRLVNKVTDQLCDINVISQVIIDEKHEIYGFAPAINPDEITLFTLRSRIYEKGEKAFLPHFKRDFPGVVRTIDELDKHLQRDTEDILLKNLKIK